MEEIAVTRLGSLLIIHHDNPSRNAVRDRVCALLHGGGRRLPVSGIIEAWAGDSPDEFHWKTVVGLPGTAPSFPD